MNRASAWSPEAVLCLHYCYQFTAFLCDFWESGSPVRAIAPTGPGWHPEAPGIRPLHMCIFVEQHGHWHSPADMRFLAVLQQKQTGTCCPPETMKHHLGWLKQGKYSVEHQSLYLHSWGGSSYSSPPFELSLHLPWSDNARYLEKHWQNFWMDKYCAPFVRQGSQNIPVNLTQYLDMYKKHATELLG